MIIHICGASGSGKTTICNKLINKLKEKFVIKDLDDLRNEHFKIYENSDIEPNEFIKNYAKSYQKFIDVFIKKHKNIIFGGLNVYINKESFSFKGVNAYYPRVKFNLHSDYNFYIDLDTNIVIKRRFDREFSDFLNHRINRWIQRKDILFNDLIKNEKQTQKDLCEAILGITQFSIWKKHIENHNFYYKKHNYVFMNCDDIYEKILTLN